MNTEDRNGKIWFQLRFTQCQPHSATLQFTLRAPGADLGLFVCLSVYLSVYLYLSLSVCLSLFLSFSLSLSLSLSISLVLPLTFYVICRGRAVGADSSHCLPLILLLCLSVCLSFSFRFVTQSFFWSYLLLKEKVYDNHDWFKIFILHILKDRIFHLSKLGHVC